LQPGAWAVAHSQLVRATSAALLLLLLLLLQIIHVNLTSGEPVLLKEGQQVTFTFAVNWLPTTTPFGQRFERYLDYNFFEHKVRPMSMLALHERPQMYPCQLKAVDGV
jgi:hypothetical protein